MNLNLKIYKYIKEKQLIQAGDRVLLGLSGGADSVCLLALLSELRKRLPFSLYALHVEHGIRGAEAERDLRFSREMAERFSVPFFSVHVDVPGFSEREHLGGEEAARILRYRALREKLKELPGEGEGKIAVAHHQDDQAETVLHHLIRGSGLRGLGGMEARSGELIRPLLSVSRKEILAELSERKLPYIMDSSNSDIHYSRNRLRQVVLPELHSINENAAEHLARTAELMREADGFFQREAEHFLAEYGEIVENPETDSGEHGILKEISLPIPRLMEYPELLRRYIIMEAVRQMGTPLKDWESQHFEDISALIGKAGGAHIDLPYRMSAEHIKKNLCVRLNREIISMKRRKKI